MNFTQGERGGGGGREGLPLAENLPRSLLPILEPCVYV